MGRSAKVAKRPSRKEKAASKSARAAAKPLPPRPLTPPLRDDGEGVSKGAKKRKMMRAKAEKVRGEWLISWQSADGAIRSLGKPEMDLSESIGSGNSWTS